MSLLIRKPGILTTVQDLGRYGHRRFGINPGGAMDRTAVRLINSLLGNDENVAVLEMHFPAAEIEFGSAAVFAIAGADFEAVLDGDPVENWRSYEADKGSLLSFLSRKKGSRVYLSVAGGFECPQWLASSSANLSAGLDSVLGRRLVTGDIILFGGREYNALPPSVKIASSLIPGYSRFPTVRIVEAPESDRLTAKSLHDLINSQFAVLPESNRMGFRMQGEPLYVLGGSEMLSSAVSFGTVQLLPDGQIIVLMADHQTTGGYPRIAQAATVDLPLLAQLAPGDKVMWHLISFAEAENLAIRFESDLCRMKLGTRLSGLR